MTAGVIARVGDFVYPIAPDLATASPTMNDTVIRAESLGKSYRLGARQKAYRTLRETVRDLGHAAVKTLTGRRERSEPAPSGDFWALRGVSFEIQRGEVVGVIGRNGAGKSTLLKILSRITEPTEGEAMLRGRIGSLLEVGTGFHPELTGRENIFLNGAILGMKRAEIAGRFDDIVAFAEVEKFLDTQVKFYSSGMYLRLAFAVAAHLDPEILLVDEVLAVGDAEFQRKCLSRMGEVAKEGRTVLFVSHNMAAIERLCSRGLVIDHGGVSYSGEVSAAIRHYLTSGANDAGRELVAPEQRRGRGRVRFTRARLRFGAHETAVVPAGADVSLGLDYKVNGSDPISVVRVRVALATLTGEPAFGCVNSVCGTDFPRLPGPSGTIWVDIPSLPLNQGVYRVSLMMKSEGEVEDLVNDAFELTVQGGDFFGTGRLMPPDCGPVLVPHRFRLEPAV
jgi:lipopolysaccharide transport system ATP-binding protein